MKNQTSVGGVEVLVDGKSIQSEDAPPNAEQFTYRKIRGYFGNRNGTFFVGSFDALYCVMESNLVGETLRIQLEEGTVAKGQFTTAPAHVAVECIKKAYGVDCENVKWSWRPDGFKLKQASLFVAKNWLQDSNNASSDEIPESPSHEEIKLATTKLPKPVKQNTEPTPEPEATRSGSTRAGVRYYCRKRKNDRFPELILTCRLEKSNDEAAK